jgi:ABC-type sulfate/molybdate transport systems ATPase subunit
LQRDLDISLLLITHDLAIGAERADSPVVLKDGAVQEAGWPDPAGRRGRYGEDLSGDGIVRRRLPQRRRVRFTCAG